MYWTCEAVLVVPILMWSMINVVHSPLLHRVLPAYFLVVPDKEVEPDEPADPDEPYVMPPLQLGASTRLVMGLRRVKRGTWLTVDHHYLPEHHLRADLLRDHGPAVLQCLPGSEEACEELLAAVCSHLTMHYPTKFKFSGSGQNRRIHNLLTGERFCVVNHPHPLKLAATLAMEDFNILVKDPSNGEYRLQASATLFPAGWKLEERIGYTMADLHAPVPGWNETLGRSVNQFFDRLDTVDAMERHTLFVQMGPDLFQDDSLCGPVSLSCPVTGQSMRDLSRTSPPNPHGFSAPLRNSATPAKLLLPSEIHIRRERQIFNRLPQSGAVLFTVHTYISPLTALGDDEFAAFVDIAGRWDENMARYKGRESWWSTVVAYAEERGVMV